jgi:hypothetical protein
LYFLENLTQDEKQAVKLEIAQNLLQDHPEDFNMNDYKIAVGKGLKTLFNSNQRYVNIDKFVKSLGTNKNINLICLFDCCREKPPTKGENLDEFIT